MPSNYVLLEKVTVGAAGAASVTFNSIPQTGYTDLVVKLSTRSTSNGGYTYVSLNGSTSSYATKDIVNSNGTPLSASYSLSGGVSWLTQSSYTASTFTASEVYILNYTSSNQKTFLLDSSAENNSTNYAGGLEAARWSNTAAVTSITLTPNTGNYAQFSTFYLYGVAAFGTTPVIAPKATGGSIIQTDGTYWYHAFLASGTFTPNAPLSCDVLVVAGGGGGGYANSGQSTAGGAGAGGLRYFAAESVTSATSITVGAGGAGAVSGGAIGAGAAGGNSVFASYTSAGGAGGFSADNGGSGSGQRNNAGAGGLGNTPATSPSQGNNGGPSAGGIAGGGGGAGAASTNQNGGIGVNTYSTWASVTGTGVSGYYAGGGGGHTNGTGGTGGGANASTGSSTSAIANTGGGGGASQVSPSGSGGSGIVIVRYAV
jgi:hypothetical protein